MLLHGIDIAIIVAYLVSIVLVGLILKKRAERSKKDYLLGAAGTESQIPPEWQVFQKSNRARI